MARKAVVFFSHSSRDKERSVAIAKAIDATPVARAVIDAEDLRQGHEWKRQLYRWIARSDAGFLLLTRQVMEHPGWVLQEAALLRARQIYEGDRFPLFVIVEPDARTHANWALLFEPLSLAEMQQTDPGAAAHDIANVVAEGCAALADAEAGDYFSQLKGLLAEKLGPFASEGPWLRRLHRDLDVADASWQTVIGPDSTPAGALAQALTTRLCEADEGTAIGAFGGLDDLFSYFQGRALRTNRETLLLALRPYWVNLGAAMRLAVAMHQPAGQRLCALRTSHAGITPDLHVDRMFAPLGRAPIVIRVTGGNESAVDLEAQVLEGWNDRMVGKVASTAELNAKLRDANTRFLVVLPPLELPLLASAVAATFPLLTVLVPVAHDVDLGHPDWRAFQALAPERRPEVESALVNQYDFAQAYV